MPRPRQATAASRSHFSLDVPAGRCPQTNKRREHCLSCFLCWLCHALGDFISIADLSMPELNTALIASGKHLFYEGEPRYLFAEIINALVALHPQLKGQLVAAWSMLSRWEESEPTVRSMIMPASVFQAAISLSILWGWRKFAAALLISFYGLLRPCEFLPLLRSDLVLPRDVVSIEFICYVRLLHSKTSRFMLRQHARISDRATVRFLDSLFGLLPRTELLFGVSASVFRNRWNKLFGFLGICTSEKHQGITPRSLCGSGASWLFYHTEDIKRVLWRGRWQSRQTLEHYLQDVMGQVLLADLPRHKRDLVLEFAEALAALLEESLTSNPMLPR